MDYSLTWNTRSDSQTRLDEGDYALVFQYQTADNVFKKTAKLPLTIDNTPPYASLVVLNKSFVTKANLKDLSLNFKLFEQASANILLFSANKTLLQTLDSGCFYSGTQVLALEAISSNLQTGQYLIGASFYDEAGNEGDYYCSLNVVDAVTLDIQSDKPYYLFTPDGGAINETIAPTIRFFGAGSKQILIDVKNDTGKEIVSLVKQDATDIMMGLLLQTGFIRLWLTKKMRWLRRKLLNFQFY